MRFLVDIENFNIKLFPTARGVLGDEEKDVIGDSDAPSFARPCHTVDAWQTFSGNLPISLISPSGRKKIKTGIDHIDIGKGGREKKLNFICFFACYLFASFFDTRPLNNIEHEFVLFLVLCSFFFL